MTDVTPDERRRVAERLRLKAHPGMSFNAAKIVIESTLAMFGDNVEWSGNRVPLRLADLIDPTCTMEESFTEPVTPFQIQEYLCSACGEYSIYQVLGDGDGPKYCSCCGARVTREDIA